MYNASARRRYWLDAIGSRTDTDKTMKSETVKVDEASAARARRRVARASWPHGGPVRAWVVTALFVLAVFYTLYLARELILPIVLALLLHFLLRPAVRGLQRIRVPIFVASGLVVLALVVAVGYAGYALSEPIAEWVQKSPEIMRQVERKLRPIKEKVQEVDKAAAQVEKITTVEQRTPTVQVRTTSMREAIWARLQPLISGAVVMFFLLYFLLATGERLTQRVAELAVTRDGMRRVLDITEGIERSVSRHLSAVTLINAGLGVCVALMTYAFGMPNPLLWGAMTMLFNFVPYVGSLITLSVLTLVALLTFDSASYALLVPASFLVLATIEGQVVAPFVLGRRLALNPVIVFLAIIFWGWLWGPAGALLAVPILVTLKIICDHVPPLAPWSVILGRC